MQNVSVRLDPETLESVEAEADERDMTRAAYLREIIENRHESDELETELERLQTELDRIRKSNQQILDQRDENRELRKYAKNDKEWHEADIFTRIKWYLRGKE